jgi:cation diffusion facilitator family transporter
MTKLIMRIFVRDYKNTENPAVRRRYGVVAGGVGIACNILLATLKLIVGVVSSSVAIIGDAVNNFSDAASSLLTLIGFHMAGKPADREHPFGHARMEYLVGLIVSVIVAMLGFEMLTSAFSSIKEVYAAISAGETPNSSYSTAATVVMVASVTVKLWMSYFNRRVGKLISSDSLAATAADSLGDAIATGAIVLGMLLSPFTGPYTDGVLGIAISVYIIYLGIKLIIETSSPILGEPPDREDVENWKNMLLSYDGVLGIHDMSVHTYGKGRTFMTVHIEVDASKAIIDSHDMIDCIEMDFAREFGVELTVHLDPVCLDDEELNSMRVFLSRLLVGFGEQYGISLSYHDLRLVRGVSHSNLIFDLLLPCEWRGDEEELTDAIKIAIKEKNPHYNCVICVDRDYTATK